MALPKGFADFLSQAVAPDGSLNIDVGALAPGACFEFEDQTYIKRKGQGAICLNDGTDVLFGQEQRVTPARLTPAGEMQMEMLWHTRKAVRFDPREVPAPYCIQ